MLKLSHTEVYGWEAAIRGMRNPMNSWGKSDSQFNVTTYWDEEHELVYETNNTFLGENDHDLMMTLAKAGRTHAKYRRMITVTVDITAPLYWWKEFDTYKVGTVANSCSTMHKIHDRPFTIYDFSCEHLSGKAKVVLEDYIIPQLNEDREDYIAARKSDAVDAVDAKDYWWNMIQLLPTSYNQKRTILFNYEVLAAMYRDRRCHKLDEWHIFCDWITGLPYSELITLGL